MLRLKRAILVAASQLSSTVRYLVVGERLWDQNRKVRSLMSKNDKWASSDENRRFGQRLLRIDQPPTTCEVSGREAPRTGDDVFRMLEASLESRELCGLSRVIATKRKTQENRRISHERINYVIPRWLGAPRCSPQRIAIASTLPFQSHANV